MYNFLKNIFWRVAALFSGIPLSPANGNWHELYYLWYEVALKDEYESRRTTKDSVVFDVGAHIGTFSSLCKGTVLAFEPSFGNYKALRKNTDAEAYLCALGEKEGIAALRLSATGSASNSLKDRFVPAGEEKVFMTTIDSFCDRRGLKPSFLKIDAEGSELDILKGAQRTIKEAKPFIAMSGYHNPDDPEVLSGYLRTLHPYRITRKKVGPEIILICEP